MVSRTIRSFRRSAIELLERRALLSTSLDPVADADVQSSSSNAAAFTSNFGADANMRVRGTPDETFETFLTFNVSSINTVGRATLRLHGGQGATVANSNAVFVGAFATPNEFNEGTGSHGNPLSILPGLLGGITFNNRPGSTGEALGAAAVTTDGDYYFDLTSYVAASKTTGDNLVTIAMRKIGGGAGLVTFGSKEGASADTPQLIIEENAAGPKASFSAPDITAAGGTNQQIVVTYTDTDGINDSSFDTSDIDVRRPGGDPLEVTGMSIKPTAANTFEVTYTVAAPGGSWDASDAYSFTTLLKDGAVKDLAGNPATGGPDVFLNLAPAQSSTDTQKPTAQFTTLPPDVTTEGGTGTTVGVTFADNVGVNIDAVTSSSLLITRRDGLPANIQVLDVGTNPSSDSKSAEVLFNIVAPGGSWDAADNGVFDVQIAAGTASDAAGNASDPASISFGVQIVGAPPVADTTAPVATVVPLEPLIEEGGSDHQIRVTYVDNVAIDLATIDVGDLVVSAPNGAALLVTDVSVSPPAGGQSITATYTVAAPGDLWESGDNGVYNVATAAGAVNDTSGNAASAAVANFTVVIPEPPPPIDPTFGGGTITVNTGFVAEAAVSQPADGKIIVAGRQGDLDAGTSQLVIQRLNADGTLDTSFGTGGKVTGPEGNNDAAYAIAIDAEGNIIVAGRRGNDMLVGRYRSTGALDTRFADGAGFATADQGGDDVAYSLVIAPDGSILLAGGSIQAGNTNAFAFARFLKDGRKDPFFGDAGNSLFAQGGNNVAGAVTLDSTGRIVAAGPGEDGHVALVRLSSTGLQDATFGASGILVFTRLATRTDLGRPDRSISVVAQSDGTLLVTNHSPDGDFAVAKVDANGALVSTFGDTGVATIDFGGDDDADQILVQGSGEILVLGTTDAGGGKLAVTALSQNGVLLPAFGDAGKLIIDTAPVSSARELHLGQLVLRAFGSVTNDGRLVVGVSDQRPAAVTSTPLQRLNVPGSGSLGSFGRVNGTRKAQKLLFQDKDGTIVTLTMKGPGSGQAFYDGSSLDLVLSGVSNSSLVIKTAGGADGRINLRNVMADGNLKSVSAKTTDLTGTFSVLNGGGINKLALGAVTGTLATAGSIGSAIFAGDVKGKILSGANYGVNGKPGGAGTAADSFSQGHIGKITVAGSTVGATFAAGVDPVNQKLLDGDDTLIGGTNSSIGAIAIKQDADPSTRFVAGSFPKRAKLPQPVDPLNDPRFTKL